MATETAQLLGRGKRLPLVDGSSVTILFTAYALAVIEEDYGFDRIDDIFNSNSAANTAADPEADPVGNKPGMIRTVGELLALGVIDREMSGEQLLKALPLEGLREAVELLKAAFEEAFPKANREQRQATEKAERTSSASPGTTSSTSGAPSFTNLEASSGV